MPETPANSKADVWPKNRNTYYVETLVIILIAILSMALQYGKFDTSVFLSIQLGVRIFGTLCIWFANKYIIEYVLQSRIDANKVTQFLPFELAIASVSVTSVIYFMFYPILSYLNDTSFVLENFLRGLFATCGFSLLIVIFYAGIHIWQSWLSDGEFLFRMKTIKHAQNNLQNYIKIKNSKGSVNHDLNEVLYFISESKVAFLVDSSGKKWMTQYTLSELEDKLGGRYFRLNRKILVSREVISQIKKLPNHRLLVTISQPNKSHDETISRYKSTRFKHWYESSSIDE